MKEGDRGTFGGFVPAFTQIMENLENFQLG
jgi:hypothetical protein